MEEGEKDQIEFVEARKDAAKTFEPAEQPLDFVAPAVHGFVVLPGLQAVRPGRNHRNKAEIQRQLQGFVVFVGAVHDQMQGAGKGPMPPSSLRPSTVSEACPGERAKVMAVRASAATI